MDSAVQGLEFSYNNRGISGLTDANGAFRYIAGEVVEFRIGDISLGLPSIAKTLVNPLSAGTGSAQISDNSATNIARFLQVLDEDADPTNGIVITENMRTLAAGRSIDFEQSPADFEADGNVQTIVAELTASTGMARTLDAVSIDAARQHLRESMEAIVATLADDYTGTSLSDFVGCSREYRDSVANGTIQITSIRPGGFPETYSFSGNGSFSANVQGSQVREELTMSGVIGLDGGFAGTLFSESYVNGQYAGAGSSGFSGFYNSVSLILDLPPISFGGGCNRYGQIVVRK